MGGAGSAVAEALNAAGDTVAVLQLGLPDVFIDHGDQQALLAAQGLDAAGIEASVRGRFAEVLEAGQLAGGQGNQAGAEAGGMLPAVASPAAVGRVQAAPMSLSEAARAASKEQAAPAQSGDGGAARQAGS